MTKEQALQEIRSSILCDTYLEKSKSGLYCCPHPDCGSGHGKNGTGAVKIYTETNTWYCHACNRGGDIIDLYQLKNGTDFNTTISLMAQEAGIVIDNAPSQKNGLAGRATSGEKARGRDKTPAEAKAPKINAETPTADYMPYYKKCNARIGEKPAADYLQKRGISLTTAHAFLIGYDPAADPANAPGAGDKDKKPHPCPRIIIPASAEYYTGRRIDGATDYKYMNSKGTTPAMFNAKTLYTQEAQEVFVVESAFDAISILEAGYPAVAMNSAGNGRMLLKTLEQNRTAATLILCPDSDPEPGTAAKIKGMFERLSESLTKLNVFNIIADINGKYKDANEHLTGNKEAFTKALGSARRLAIAERERQIQEVQEAERERQQRTGAGMVDTFLEAVQTHKYEPVPTGITDIDKALGGGFFREQIILLGAAPGAGKTALAQWIFEGMARRGQTCLYLNLEMSREQMLARSLSRIAGEDGRKIKPTEILQGYKWNGEQEYIVTEAAKRYKAEIAPRMIYNPEGVSAELDSILKYIEEEATRAENAQLPVPCVVLDYLQIVRGREREEETAVIKRAMEELKKFAMRHHTFVFMIIAHNRNANKSGEVTQESGRDTSALEYGADLQLGLAYTFCMEKYGGKNKNDLTPEELRHITMVITKGRWSETGAAVNLYFDGETMTYKQISRGAIAEAPQQLKAGRKL